MISLKIVKGKNNEIKSKNKNYLTITYTDEIGRLYKVSDIVISRAGATTINELKALSKKAILIPLSSSTSRGDQVVNAQKVCQTNNSFLMIEDETIKIVK